METRERDNYSRYKGSPRRQGMTAKAKSWQEEEEEDEDWEEDFEDDWEEDLDDPESDDEEDEGSYPGYDY